MDFNVTSHKCWLDNISNKFDFQGPGLMVKVSVAIFRKTLSLLKSLHLSMEFNITSHKWWVWQYLKRLTFSLLGSWSTSLWLFLEKKLCHLFSAYIYQWILISHKCWVWQYFEQVWLSGSWAQGQGHYGYFQNKTFVITPAPTFIDGFYCKITQM